jgi:hypothetical protein
MSGFLLITFNEGGTGYISADFQDKNETSQAPTSARYRIDCKTNGVQVRDWTAITAPQAVHEIMITSSDNAIIDPAQEVETKEITVEATYGVGDVIPGQVAYGVKNLNNYP